MYISQRVTRHMQNGEVVGFVVKYDPPSPPIHVYIVEGENLERILPNGESFQLKQGELERSIIAESIENLKVKYPNMLVEDVDREFKPRDYLTNPRGEYDIL